MSGNLLPLFLNPVPASGGNSITGGLQFGSNAPLQFDSTSLFGSMLNKAMSANSVTGAIKPLTTAALGAYALNGSAGVSDLGSLLMNKIAANYNTSAAGLQAQIQQMLASGQSMASIIANLASQMAGTVGDALSLDNGPSGIIARTRLMQAFSQALAPPGTAPPSAAQGAAALAQRFVQVANIVAAGATQSQDVGQQYRYPGTSLDANLAKVSPAPNANTVPSFMAAAFASSIQANLTAALPAPPPGSPTTNGTSSLQSRISAALASGASTDQVVYALSSSLGNSVANAIGADNVTRASLQAAYAQRFQAAGTPDQVAAQLAAQATAIAQQATAQITGGVTPGQVVTALNPTLVSSTPGGSDVLQRILQRAQNQTAIASGGTTQLHPTAQTGVAASGQGTSNGSNGTGAGANGNPNVNLSSLAAQQVNVNAGSATSSQAPVDAFLANFTQAMTDLRGRESGAGDAASATATPSGGTQAFLASIGTVDSSQNAVQPAATPIATPNPSDPNNVVSQVLQGIFLRNVGSSTEVRMKLQPDNLGDVHVKLNMDNGNVSATIIAQNTDVRDTLLANQAQLTRQLADAGLKLQGFSVNVSGGESNPFAQQQQAAFHSGTSGRGLTTSADDAQADGVDSAIPTFGPPVLASVNRGLLDYLV